MSALNCAIIGFGGLGKVHFNNLRKMESDGYVKIAALCDAEESAFTTKTDINLGSDETSIDLSQYKTYNNYKDLLKNEKLDFVVIAVPTYLHAEITVAALESGVHAFCEKPMAISISEAEKMLDTSNKTGKKLMIGQCLRYWREYAKLKEFVDNGIYGKVVRADFSRLSLTPRWSWQDWYLDEAKSGGALLDLHVHDVDIINYLFGKPISVISSATHIVTKFDSVSTSYIYNDKTVTATGDWGLPIEFGFRMGFLVKFEKAAVEMGVNGFKIYTGDEALTPELTGGDAYYNEVSDFIDCINNNKKSEVNPPESSLLTLKIAMSEKESALKGEILNV